MTTQRRGDIMDTSTSEYLCTEQYPDWLWRKLDRFQDWRFGLFMHWGPCSLLGCDTPLQVTREGSAVVVTLPSVAPCRHDWALRYRKN